MTKAIDTKGGFLVRDKEIESERVFNGSFKILNCLFFFKKRYKHCKQNNTEMQPFAYTNLF